MSEVEAVGVRGWGSVAARAGSLLPEDLDPLYQPLLGRRLRKVGRFIKLAVAGAAAAVHRSGLGTFPTERTGVFLGTGLGNLPDLVGFTEAVLGGETAPSPTQFANSVGNAGAFYVAQAYGLTGPTLSVSQDEVSFECALLSAVALFEAGDLDVALVGGVDVYWPGEAAQRARMGYGPHEPPFLGEGSGWVVLERRSEHSAAELAEVSVSLPDDPGVPGDWVRHLADPPVPAPTMICLGTRLGARAEDLKDSLPPHASLIESGFGTYLAESGANLCVLLDRAAAGWGSLHTAAETREGLRGRVSVRAAGRKGGPG
ncbi:MAG: hypothetical protein HY900_03190 [Deltaproteobacteria bacterium]|nr:hypothetical protein [Deltaproteobacteria bacterium]